MMTASSIEDKEFEALGLCDLIFEVCTGDNDNLHSKSTEALNSLFTHLPQTYF